MQLRYSKVDYHKALRKGDPPKVSLRGKSKCDGGISLDEAQELLNVGYRHAKLPNGKPKAVFVKRMGLWYRALAGSDGTYHGSPVTDSKVPSKAKLQKARWIR